MLWTLLIVGALGCWALHLMDQAYQRQEFSRMLAGLLVVFAAGGVLTTYFIMSDYITYVLHGDSFQIQAYQEPSEFYTISMDWTVD